MLLIWASQPAQRSNIGSTSSISLGVCLCNQWQMRECVGIRFENYFHVAFQKRKPRKPPPLKGILEWFQIIQLMNTLFLWFCLIVQWRWHLNLLSKIMQKWFRRNIFLLVCLYWSPTPFIPSTLWKVNPSKELGIGMSPPKWNAALQYYLQKLYTSALMHLLLLRSLQVQIMKYLHFVMHFVRMYRY